METEINDELLDEKSSRDRILATIRNNQPPLTLLPEIKYFEQSFTNLLAQFKLMIPAVGGFVKEVNNVDEIINILKIQYNNQQRIISVLPEFSGYAEIYNAPDDPHKLDNVEVAIIKAHFGVAENGAVWVTENILQDRVLPFICQHLVAVINEGDLVATMQQAYDKIHGQQYGFGTFIAGPSKTADIEQSLVLGAHGPKTMTVFVIKSTVQ